jgi:hypothetical protein
LLVALLVVAAVSGPTNQTAQSEGGGQEDGEDEKKAESKKSKKGGGSGNVEAAVGETVELDDQTLTVAEVQRNYNPQNRFQKTEQGNEFLRVWVMLTNTSDRPFNYGQFDFEVQDSNGVQKRAEYISELPYNLDSGDLAPGGNVEGNLVFEVPRNDNNLRLVYTSNMFSGQTVTVGPL